jgi:hypothetical protein
MPGTWRQEDPIFLSESPRSRLEWHSWAETSDKDDLALMEKMKNRLVLKTTVRLLLPDGFTRLERMTFREQEFMTPLGALRGTSTNKTVYQLPPGTVKKDQDGSYDITVYNRHQKTETLYCGMISIRLQKSLAHFPPSLSLIARPLLHEYYVRKHSRFMESQNYRS